MPHKSSTKTVADVGKVPLHIAIIMAGISAWAQHHKASQSDADQQAWRRVVQTVDACLLSGIEFLSLQVPLSEIERDSALSDLILNQIAGAFNTPQWQHVRVRTIGDWQKLSTEVQEKILLLEQSTEKHAGLTLTLCINYDSQWDIVQALNHLRKEPGFVLPVTEEKLAPFLSLAYAPEPDLFIRTGGELQLSNFLLWQLAYSELYFTDTTWPDFDPDGFRAAIDSYQTRERRFGRTSAQLCPSDSAKNKKAS